MVRLPPWLINGLIILIAVTWAGSFIAGIFIASYEPPVAINGVFAAVITVLLSDRRRNGKDEEEEPAPDKKRPRPKARHG